MPTTDTAATGEVEGRGTDDRRTDDRRTDDRRTDDRRTDDRRTDDRAVEVDGRRLRREQNRDAVLDAMSDLFREGNYQPNVNDIADRAGLSPRSLFRYFDDVDDLRRATIERQLEAAKPLLDPGVTAEDPTSLKVQRLVAARCRLHEFTAPAARAARAGANHALIAAQVHGGRAYLRHQIQDLFAAELANDPALLAAIDTLCSFESYELLRTDQGMAKATVRDTLIAAIGALLRP